MAQSPVEWKHERKINGGEWEEYEPDDAPKPDEKFPNRATRRAMNRDMRKHSKCAFICPGCRKPFVAPLSQKCACPVARHSRQTK